MLHLLLHLSEMTSPTQESEESERWNDCPMPLVFDTSHFWNRIQGSGGLATAPPSQRALEENRTIYFSFHFQFVMQLATFLLLSSLHTCTSPLSKIHHCKDHVETSSKVSINALFFTLQTASWLAWLKFQVQGQCSLGWDLFVTCPMAVPSVLTLGL